MSEFQVPSKHTPEMMRAEADAMLGFAKLRLCLGHLMLLAEAKSPYVYGGRATELDTELARRILKAKMGLEQLHIALIEAMDTAFRPMELFDADEKPDKGGKKSDVRPFTPEWCADVIRAACHAVPSLTLQAVLWEVPLVMVMHLGVAEARAYGATTRRPPDYKAALRMHKERMENARRETKADR